MQKRVPVFHGRKLAVIAMRGTNADNCAHAASNTLSPSCFSAKKVSPIARPLRQPMNAGTCACYLTSSRSPPEESACLLSCIDCGNPAEVCSHEFTWQLNPETRAYACDCAGGLPRFTCEGSCTYAARFFASNGSSSFWQDRASRGNGSQGAGG